MNKYIIGILTLVALIGGWNFFQSSDEGVKTGQKPSQIQPKPIQTTTGNIWSGSTYSGGYQPVHFQMPNTNWQTRTYSGITYVFGEGNPKEVALTASGIQQEFRTCEINPESTDRMCREGMYGYITPEIELALKNALESTLWNDLVTKCQSEFESSPYKNRFLSYILSPGTLDISHFLLIDENTGRKELDTARMAEAVRAIGSSLESVDSLGNTHKNICIEQYGQPLMQMLDNVRATYGTFAAYANQQGTFEGFEIQYLNHDLIAEYWIYTP